MTDKNNKSSVDTFVNKSIDNIKAEAVKEFAQELIYEIENRPPSKAPDGAFYFNGREDRQKEIIEIIKEKAGAD